MIEKLSSDQLLFPLTLLVLAAWSGVWYGNRRRLPSRIFSLQGKAIAVAVLRIACGFILVLASMDKLDEPAKFSEAVSNYKVLPLSLTPLAAVVIPWLEFFTGICLALGVKRRGAALIFCILMAVYVFALGWDLSHGIEINCYCFKMDSAEPATWLTVGRDLLFLAMGLIALFASKTYAMLDD